MGKDKSISITLKAEFVKGMEDESQFWHVVAHNKNGNYVGNPDTAKRLLERGIEPELANKDDNVCSIGKSLKDGKWYGWSHRAINGFEVGDRVEEGDCTNSSGLCEEYLEEHPEEDLSLPVGFVAKTDEDAKRMAIAFADSVG